MRLPRLFLALVVLVAAYSSARATITSVVESNLGADTPAIIVNGGFGEDTVVFSDRVHQHNGARFSDAFGAGTLLPVGVGNPETVVVNVPLPGYLLGGDYVQFANSARDNVGYSAVVTAAAPTDWYLLLDNRADGPNGNGDGTFYTDPNLGGTLQWVIDDGWLRVDTGINPPLAPLFLPTGDYTGVDESPADSTGLGVGPGISVNNFYAVYTRKNLTSVTLGNLAHAGGVSMYSLVAAAVPEPTSFVLLGCGAFGLAATRRYRR